MPQKQELFAVPWPHHSTFLSLTYSLIYIFSTSSGCFPSPFPWPSPFCQWSSSLEIILSRNSPFVGWSGAYASYWPRTMCLPIVAPFTHCFHTLHHRTEGQECDEFTVSPTSCASVKTNLVALPPPPTHALIQFFVFPGRLPRELDWHHHRSSQAQNSKTSWLQRTIQGPLAVETVSAQAPVKKYFMGRQNEHLACIYLLCQRFLSTLCLHIFQTLC